MKKIFLMLMVAAAFIACENVPGGNSGVPTNDRKAVVASTTEALALLGSEVAAVEQALVDAGYVQVKSPQLLNVPARAKKAPVFKAEANPELLYFVFGLPENYAEMDEEALLKFQIETFEAGKIIALAIVYVQEGKVIGINTEFNLAHGKKTNLLYTEISDKLYAALPTQKDASQWAGRAYFGEEEKDFDDHAAFTAAVATADTVYAQESGYGVVAESGEGLAFSGVWGAPIDEEALGGLSLAGGIISIALPTAVEPEPDPDPVDPEKEGDYKITVTNITASGATIKVVPGSKGYYYWTVVDAVWLSQLTADQVAEELIAADIEDGYSFEDLYGVYVLDGTDEYTYTTLDPETEYTVIAFGVDEDLNITTKAVTQNFTTDKLVISGNQSLEFEGEYLDYTSDYGYFAAEGYSTDDQYYFSLFVYPATSMNTTINEENIYSSYTYLVKFTGSGEDDYELYSLINPKLKSSFSASTGKLTVSGTFAASNGIEYSIKLTAEELTEDEGGYYAPAKKSIKKQKTIVRKIKK